LSNLLDEDILGGEALANIVNELVYLAGEGDIDAIVRLMDEAIPGAAVRSTPPPDMTSVI
jgi:hypothetical protein